MTVKVFADPKGLYLRRWTKSLLYLEEEINAWLEANPGIRIVHIKQSCCGGDLSGPKTVISVWYEPKS